MKILHILNTDKFSGAENVAITIIKNLKGNYNGAYASLDGTIQHKLKQEKVNYYPMDNMSISQLKRIISDYHPDVIHAHDFTSSVIASLTNTKVPIVSHIHHNAPWLKQAGLNSILYLLSSKRYKTILGVSEAIFKEYIFGNLIINKTKVISNPIDTNVIIEKSKNGKNDYYDLVFLGRLSTPKNPLKFIDLVSSLARRRTELKVAIIGSGELDQACKIKIKELSLENNIDMLGFMDNPYGIVRKAKILCMTSDWEGYGLVAVEALALGTPVIAYPVGGLKEIVNSSCGSLVSNDREYIKEIDKMLSDKEYLKVKSINSIKRAKSLENINEYMEELITIYNKIVM